MFLNGYFYWCGVLMNLIVLFGVLMGSIAVVQNWRNEIKIRKKYATKDLKKCGKN